MTMMRDIEVHMHRLIPIIQSHPILWDKTYNAKTPQYKELSTAAWNDVCVSYNPNFEGFHPIEKKLYGEVIMKKWRNVKDIYRKYILGRRAGKNNRKYIYSKELRFLEKFVSESRQPVYKPEETNPSTDTIQKPFVSISSDDDDDDYEYNLPPVKAELGSCGQPSVVSFERIQSESEISQQHSWNDEHLRKNSGHFFKEIDERHMCFFKGVIPSLRNFNEKQVLKFQMGILGLINSLQESNDAKVNDPLKESNGNMFEAEEYRVSESKRPRMDKQTRFKIEIQDSSSVASDHDDNY